MRKKRIYIAPETDSVHLTLRHPAMKDWNQGNDEFGEFTGTSMQTTQDGTDETYDPSTFGFFEEEEIPVQHTSAWDDWKY